MPRLHRMLAYRRAAILITASLLIVLALARSGPFGHNTVVLVLTIGAASTAWNLLAGYTGQISFASAIFFGIGAYTTGFLLLRLDLNPWAGSLVGALLAAGVSVLIGFPVFRLRAIYFSIATIALQQVAFTAAINTEQIGGTTGLALPVKEPSLLTLQFAPSNPFGYPLVALGLFALTMLVVRLYLAGKAGLYARSIREDQDAAQMLGVRVRRYKLFALALSSALISLTGSFYGMYALYVDPNFTISIDQSLVIAMPAIIGGLGTAWGPLVGAGVLVLLQQLTRIYLSSSGQALDFVTLGVLVMLIAVRWPTGVVGLARSFMGGRRWIARLIPS